MGGKDRQIRRERGRQTNSWPKRQTKRRMLGSGGDCLNRGKEIK